MENKIKITKQDILENEGKVLHELMVDGIDYYNDGYQLEWKLVLKCGGHNDFVIYIDDCYKSYDQVAKMGHKVGPDKVKHIFDFEEGVEELFRW